MMEHSIKTMQDLEHTACKIYERIHPLLHNDAKMSVEDMCHLSKIAKNCSSILKNVAKFHNELPKTHHSDVIL